MTARSLRRDPDIRCAGCRDSVAARHLGFVPAASVGAALELARGRADGDRRVGYLLAPPYFPLRVSAG